MGLGGNVNLSEPIVIEKLYARCLTDTKLFAWKTTGSVASEARRGQSRKSDLGKRQQRCATGYLQLRYPSFSKQSKPTRPAESANICRHPPYMQRDRPWAVSPV